MITISNITKSFGALQVLKGIDLHIDKGEVVSIVGPSGAGKTTLLQIIGTLDRPDTGTVRVDGIDVTSLSSKRLSDFRNTHLGFVFQFHQLLPEFTALENIMIPAYIAGKSQKAAKARAEELLQFMGLSDRASHKPNELSGGEKQRIAVARALVNNPAVILADEPSGSLDTRNKEDLHKLFFDLRDQFGQTFVIVTHDESNTLRIKKRTDYGLYLDGGDEGNILLPNRYVTPDMRIGDNLEVFIYLDQDERTIATTEHPIAKVGEFAYLECAWTNEYGAFLKWGLMKDLFCPFREQKKRMEIGKTYYVYIMEDEKTHRLMATAKVERYQKNDGRQRVLDFAEVLLRYLYEHDGKCDLGDKSPAEQIYERFQISKKDYKKAIGDLYRRRLIVISEEGIQLVC